MFIFLKHLKETMNRIINGGKTLRERILKTTSSSVKDIILNINLQKVCVK